MAANTTPEMYDDDKVVDKEAEKEHILKNESDILEGLLTLEKTKDQPENYRKIQIKRQGKVLLEFRVRPVTDDENRACMKQATPMGKNQNVQLEINWTKYRSLLIYSATVNEDREKIWDNSFIRDSMGIMQGWELIDKVILAGEKAQIIEVIDEISGGGAEVAEMAKNL